ncbi:MAG: recombinase family protein [Catenulispora sp.]|nr:recombinase family protein [Catenulispora sp.]
MDDPAGMLPAAGIYCCVPHIDDDDQSTVDRRELRCRDYARRHGIDVASAAVYADTARAVWKPDGARPGWDALLTAVAAGRIKALIIDSPGALARHRAADLVRLLEAGTRNGVALHSVGDAWNLAEPADRRTLLERATVAVRSARAVSRASRAAHQDAAAAGRPHGGGRRAFGYEAGMGALIPAESKVVREIFARFLDGETLRAIALDLNAREVPTSLGSAWTVGGVARVLDAPRYAGIRVFRGQVRAQGGGYQLGAWEPCVSIEDWERARVLRSGRGSRAAEGEGRGEAEAGQRHDYLLTGLVECRACGHSMVGSIVGGYRMYACASTRGQPPEQCARSIGAASFEGYVEQDAIRILESWDAARVASLPMVGHRRSDVLGGLDGSVAHRGSGGVGGSGARSSAISLDRPDRLDRPGRPDRADQALYDALHAGVVVRSAAAIEGIVTGPGAGLHWPRVPLRRRADVLRFLYTVIRVGPKTTSRGVFDTGRIALVPHPL